MGAELDHRGLTDQHRAAGGTSITDLEKRMRGAELAHIHMDAYHDQSQALPVYDHMSDIIPETAFSFIAILSMSNEGLLCNR